MKNSTKCILYVGIIMAIMLLTAHAIDMNCLQLPAAQMKYVQSCCRFPRFKFHVYDKQCKHVAYKSGIFGLDRYFNPCALACVFNTSSVMHDAYTPKLQRVHAVLNAVLDDKQFLYTYYQSFQSCMPLVGAKIAAAIAKGRTAILDGRTCSNVPIMYGICAHAQTFLNCPRSAWLDTKQCNETKKYLSACINKI